MLYEENETVVARCIWSARWLEAGCPTCKAGARNCLTTWCKNRPCAVKKGTKGEANIFVMIGFRGCSLAIGRGPKLHKPCRPTSSLRVIMFRADVVSAAEGASPIPSVACLVASYKGTLQATAVLGLCEWQLLCPQARRLLLHPQDANPATPVCDMTRNVT